MATVTTIPALGALVDQLAPAQQTLATDIDAKAAEVATRTGVDPVVVQAIADKVQTHLDDLTKDDTAVKAI